MSERYRVIEGSQSAHCCFEYTVVDTAKPSNDYEGDVSYEAVCECFEREDADLIAKALNNL